MKKPFKFTEFTYDSISSDNTGRVGEVPGLWLLTYEDDDSDVIVNVGIYPERESALAAAADLEEVTGICQDWYIELVPIAPEGSEETALMVGMDFDEDFDNNEYF